MNYINKMEKILDIGGKYKYEMGGVILVIILYLISQKYFKDSKKEIVKKDVKIDREDKSLKMLLLEIKNMSGTMKKMIEENRKVNPRENYFSFRNEYFTKDIEKKRILVDTKSMGSHTTDEHSNTSEYKVLFGFSQGSDSSIPINTICFGDKLNDIIGFRLTRATIPDTLYNITDTNKQFRFTYNGDSKAGVMRPGSYTFETLATEFQRAMNEQIGGSDPFTVASDTGSFKYTITFSTGYSLVFNWNIYANNVHKLVGGSGVNGDESATSPHTFPNTVDHSVHFVDLIIDEIPSIATKISANGKKIIDRIPLTGIQGNLSTYIPLEEGTPWVQNYFYPINITQLSIKLYDDTTTELFKNNNNDHMLEFEISILKNSKLLG
jgi:hypothetical protein